MARPIVQRPQACVTPAGIRPHETERRRQGAFAVSSAADRFTPSSPWRMEDMLGKTQGRGADLAMTSDSDDLEQALQENLKLRGELAVEVAKSKDISRQRVSRDFHRLGLIFALIAGTVRIMFIAHDVVTLRLWEVTYGDLPVVLFGALVGLVEVAVVCLAVYVLIRAIGWVINNLTPS
jgi:hypothetical protein